MKKRIQLSLLIVSLMTLMISGCSEKGHTEEKYLEYNKTIENYILALIAEDYYTMSQFLPKKSMQGDFELENATEKDKPQDIEKRRKMGDRYAIYAFDYFYEKYGEMYYLIEYYDFRHVNNKKERLVFGVRKENDRFIVFNKYGLHIEATHFKEITNNDNYVTPELMESIIASHPENSFVLKEYPD